MSFYNPTLSTISSRQWRRLSIYETYAPYSSPGRAPVLTCRVPRELEWAINNAKAFVLAPRRQLTFFPPLDSTWASLDERVMHVFAPMEFADGYTKIRWDIGHEKFVGEGPGGSVTWRLYCSWSLYRGPDIFDASYLSPWYGSDSIVSDITAHTFDGAEGLQVTKDASGLVWLVLTAQSSSVNVQAQCTQLSIVGRMP